MTDFSSVTDREYNGARNGACGEERTHVYGDRTHHTEEEEGEVEVDGIITDFFKKQGTYRPREHEVETWGPYVGDLVVPDNVDELLNKLIYSTACVRWRECLLNMVRESKAEHTTRQILAFLYANSFNGIKALNEGGYGTSVQMGTNPAPSCLLCHDWMSVMEGLNFETTSPGAVRDIGYVDVTIGKHSEEKTLEGFCHLMKSLLDLTWTNLHTLCSVVTQGEGMFLFNMLQMLTAGCGMDASQRVAVDQLMGKYPHMMKCLGFIQNEGTTLQWEHPVDNTESNSLFHAIHGLFRSAESIESVL